MKIVRVSKANRLALYRFRYSIYVEEMNRTQNHADHKNKTICDPLDSFGHALIAQDRDNKIIGTIRVNFCREGDVGDYSDYYRLSHLSDNELLNTSITTRLMIAPEHRAGNLAVRLSIEAYNYGVENGIESDFIDCNPPLDKYFERMGYMHQHSFTHPEYGDVNVMKLQLTDMHHLENIKSPFGWNNNVNNSSNERISNNA